MLENRGLGLARLLGLYRLVYSVVGPAPLRPDPVVLDEGLPHRTRDLHDLLLEERGRAEGRAPRDLVGEAVEKLADGRHLGHRADRVVNLAAIAQVVADAPVELVVVRGAAHLALEVAEILHEKVPGAVLADLEILAAGMDAAEDAREARAEHGGVAHVLP